MSGDKVKISIIVPVYNVEDYLRECLDSLINQTLKDIEIICINDASPDNSLAILEEYAKADDRISIINLEENKRQGGARNEGIKIAEGTYIGMVDSDDWIELDMYEKLWNASEAGKLDMVVSSRYFIDKKDSSAAVPNVPLEVLKSSKEKLDKHILIKGGRIWTNIFKRSLFFDNQLFYPEKLAYEDHAIGACLYLVAKSFSYVDEPFYHYRQVETSTTKVKLLPAPLDIEKPWIGSPFFNKLKTSVILFDNLKRLGFYEKYKEECEYKFYYLYYRSTIIGCFYRFPTVQREYIDYIKKEFPKYVDISKNKYFLASRYSTKIDIFIQIVNYNTALAVSIYKLTKKILR